MSDLFRPEAIEARSRRYGSVLKLGKGNYWLMVSVLGVAIILVVAGATLINYEKWDLATGATAFERPPIIIFPPYRAVVDRLLVSDGQVVKRGQAIAEIHAPYVSETADDPITLQRDALSRLAATKQESERISTQKAKLDVESIRRRQEALDKQARSLSTELIEQEKDTARIKGFIEKLQSEKYKDVLPRVQLMDYESRLTSAKASEASLNRQISELMATREALDNDAQSIARTRSVEAEDSKAYLAQLESNRLESVMERRGTVYAQVGGTVSNIQISPFATVDQTEPILTIAPLDSRIVGQVALTGDQAAAINPGDSIRLRFGGFDFRTRGEVRAKIVRVSAAPAFQTLGDASGFGKEPTPYRAIVVIDKNGFGNVSRGQRMLAGMGFYAVITKSKGPLFERLFQFKKNEDKAAYE